MNLQKEELSEKSSSSVVCSMSECFRLTGLHNGAGTSAELAQPDGDRSPSAC